jgi:uncharacterized protein involved in outer membrane biogenesis
VNDITYFVNYVIHTISKIFNFAGSYAQIKKSTSCFISAIAITAVAIILFISPIAKYLIEKYDEKYTGRQITLDRAYVNPFTGYISLTNLKIYELKSDSIFFSANGVSASFALYKLFSKTYEISSITLEQQNKALFLIMVFHFIK